MGLGLWQGRTQWPLPWVESVQCLKVFGIYITPGWDEISNMNLRSQLSKVKVTLWGWDTRVLDTVEERVMVLDTFILSKIWYRAQILPMSDMWVKKFEREIYNFLWWGWITKHPVKKGCCVSRRLEEGWGSLISG